MKNAYEIKDGHVVIYANCKGETKEILIDLDNFEMVFQQGGKWHATIDGNTSYAIKRQGKSFVRLHRLIMKYHDTDKVIDHINGNGLDNRKCNLRIVTHLDNCRNRKLSKNNSSGETGVYLHRQKKKWVAQIKVNRKTKYLGIYEELEEAKEMRKVGEIVYWNILHKQKSKV